MGSMLVQEMVIDNDVTEMQDMLRKYTPQQKLSRSDVPFPLTMPRRRAPSVTSLADLSEPQGQYIGRLTIKAPHLNSNDGEDARMPDVWQPSEQAEPQRTIQDLPLEVQGKILDFIFGDMHSVNATSNSLRGKSVSSLMRHPRRKAVSNFALVSSQWRQLVQERIYRHIKIKGTRAGIEESENYFCEHPHLRDYVRHIEFWVPVWGDKASVINDESFATLRQGGPRHLHYHFADQANEGPTGLNDFLGFTYKLSVQTATLSEIFQHIYLFFPSARVFTLEGGHCKKSNMIRQFPKVLFNTNQELQQLPGIRTFAMRGAWNIMRQYSDWKTIEHALPNVSEWHCGFAKPRIEAETTIDQILRRPPSKLRHINVSLDGMYSKDPTTLSSSSLSGQPVHHLCDRLGAILGQLESISFTGKICECLWTSAIRALSKTKEEPKLQSLEIVVKSCCRQRVTSVDPETGDILVDELGGVMADGAGITNLVFIKAFERLIINTIEALRYFPNLKYVRIRFIDLDSPCTLLNPYWWLENKKVYGIWSEEIVELLNEVRPDTQYVELGDGIDYAGVVKGDESGERSPSSLYPRSKPRSIKSSSYRVIAETRIP